MNEFSAPVNNSVRGLQSDALARIGQIIRNSKCPMDLGHDVAQVVGTWLGASRVGYSRIDPVADTLPTDRDWTAPGVVSIAGVVSMRAFGTWIDDLKRDEVTRIDDARLDPRTVDSQALEDRHARSFLNVPIIESGQLTAVFFVNMADVHHWQDEEVAFIRDAAERTRTATERLVNEAALLRTTEQLRTLNASLEQRVEERSAALRLYQNIVQSDTAPICVFDRDLRVIAFNPAHNDAFTQIFGHHAQLGDVIPDLMSPEQGAVLRGFWERALAGESFVITDEFSHPETGKSAWEISYNPLRDDAGRVVAAFRHARDINAQLKAQRELTVFQETLRQSQKMEAVGQLTGGIAHDFNNMLATIMSSLELMNRRIASGKGGDLTRYLTMASTAAQSAAALIKRLLAFSRKQTLDLQALDVNVAIAQMQDMLIRSIGESIQFELALQPGLPIVRSDHNQLESALLNLAINARDAMPDGGLIRISTSNRELDAGYAAIHPEVSPGMYVMVSVSDDGMGMSPEVVAKAFDPFFTTKPIGQGTGLGLSMIYGFMRQIKGHASIHSIVGEGTTVNIYLPWDSIAAASLVTQQQLVACSPKGQGQTVLFVEDEPGVRLVLGEVLGELGYVTYEAIDAPSALALEPSLGPLDLLVTDVGLPGINGRQLAEMMRQRRPNLKVLFVTGYANKATVKDEFLGRGMDMLSKPFTIDDLAHKVQTMMNMTMNEASFSGVHAADDSVFGALL